MKRADLGKIATAILVTLSVIVGYWYFRSPEATKVKVGEVAPDLELPSLMDRGIPVKLSRFSGNPVLLVMFLSTCHICDAEIGHVERLHREFLQRGLRVVGVSVDADHASRESFARRHEITFTILEDPRGVAVRQAYGSWKFPEAYLIDAAGNVNAIFLGSVNWRGTGVRDRIKDLLPRAAGSLVP